MSQGCLDFLAPIAGLLGNCLLHIFFFRSFLRGRMFLSLVSGFLAGVSCIIFFSIAANVGFQVTVENLLTYILLSYCYFHFVNLGETARRVRLLRELKVSGCGLTLEEIRSRYNADEILSRRLDRLIKNGQVVLKEERYFIAKPIMLSIAKTIVFLKRLLLKRGGNV